LILTVRSRPSIEWLDVCCLFHWAGIAPTDTRMPMLYLWNSTVN